MAEKTYRAIDSLVTGAGDKRKVIAGGTEGPAKAFGLSADEAAELVAGGALVEVVAEAVADKGDKPGKGDE